MSAQALAEILTAYEEGIAWIEAAFAQPNATPDLPALRAQLRGRLDRLHAALSPPLPAETAIEVLVPMLFFLDERVQRALVAQPQQNSAQVPCWPLLQRDVYPDADGGDAFFELARKLAASLKPDPIVLQAYLACLNAGFTGRYFDEPEVLEVVGDRLAQRLPKPSISKASAPPYRPIPAARPRWIYGLLGVETLLVGQLLLAVVTYMVMEWP